MIHDQTITPQSLMTHAPAVADKKHVALILLWSRDEPARVGDALLIPSRPAHFEWLLGRGDPHDGYSQARLEFYRQRCEVKEGLNEPTGPIRSPRVSREQLRLTLVPQDQLAVTNIGRCQMFHNGRPCTEATLAFGDVLELKNELVFLCAERPGLLAPRPAEIPAHDFGSADAFGIVGESPSTWELRRQLAFCGPRHAHVIILGESGTGKELAAQAIHAMSGRKQRQMVSRNAATFVETLIDAELFGNTKNFPNVGTPERPGLIGQADGSSLFLDEIGDLPIAMQAHLLRVLDQGEYQRLGESTTRRSDLRLIAATNRPESQLKHDFLARLKLQIRMPDLNSRREDIPLIVRHIMRRIAASDPDIASRFMSEGPRGGEPRFTPAFISGAMRRTYTTHVRELEAILWRCMTNSAGAYLDWMTELDGTASVEEPIVAVKSSDITAEQLRESLERNNGVQEHVWKELGLLNRFALYRLMRKFGFKSDG